ncbi:MAG: riboflavin synthase, partial [Candidatus Magasanikbacteria bacterium CG10_big_fil_rev_8_21_14_0_10_38_6]
REVTNLGALQTGAAVNIEVDVISKYVASHLAHLTQS